MTPPLAVQLFTLRHECERDFDAVLERLAAIGFPGIEMAVALESARELGIAPVDGLQGMTPDTLRRRLSELGLEITGGLFTPLSLGDDLHRFLDQQQRLGNDVVVTGLGPGDVVSLDALQRAADRYSAVAEIVHGRGMSFGYHNHWWEFTPTAEGILPMDILLERLDPRIFLEVDIYWVQAAGLDPAATLVHLGERVRRLHVKDGPGTARTPGHHGFEAEPQTAVGSGALDIPGILAAAPHAEWHVIELDDCSGDMFDAVETSYRYLTQHGLSRGRE